jgi:thiamine kinase-like enzyme
MEADISTTYIHGDLNCRNILMTQDYNALVFIDFAKSNQDHSVKDIAKLESDILFLFMDSKDWQMTDWQRLPAWESILKIYNRGDLFNPIPFSLDDNVMKHTCQIIWLLRRCLSQLLPSNDLDRQYTLALIYFGIHYLSYPNVTTQKKIFGIKWINHLFRQLES